MKSLSYAVVLFLLVVTFACSSGKQEETEDTTTVSTPEPASEVTETVSAEVSLLMEQGKTVYGQYCLACHQGDGKGVPGAFPPLTQTQWTEGDKENLIGVIINGMEGPIEVKGEQYNNAMPQHGFLSDEDIAAVLTYVRQSFGNDASEITPEEVAAVRK